jgi:transcriptional regulator with XRE-family HTH domain
MTRTKYNKQVIPEITKKRLSFLGALFKEYRWQEDFTLLEVQEQSGIHHKTVSRIENGENISLVTLFRYMDFLELDFPEIAFTDDEM